MNRRDRLLTALRRETPDVVPVTWELVGRFAHALTGRSDWRAMVDAHRAIGSAVFNLQGVGPRLTLEPPDGFFERSARHEEADGSHVDVRTLASTSETLTERRKSNFMPGDPLLPKTVEYLVKNRHDYDLVEVYTEQLAARAEPDVSESDQARAYVGDDGLVGFWMCDPVYHIAHMRRDTEFIIDLVEAPDRMNRLFEAVGRLKAHEIAAFNASAAEVLVFDICWASTSLLSPEMVREFVLPQVRRLSAQISGDKIWGFFTSGRIRAVLPDLVDLGPHFIQHFDVLGDCDLAEVKRSFGDRICIIGNYNPVVLAHGSLDDARREAQRCLDAAMGGGGYIMSTSDEAPADAKPDNMKAVVEYVSAHGRY
jgi:uroporphyrinogen decarboxylase-like protein